MIRTGRSLAQGKVYYHLTAASMARIDAFEGGYYRRENVRPKLVSGTEIDAVAYVLVESMHYLPSGKPWREEDFLRKYLHRYLRYKGQGVTASPGYCCRRLTQAGNPAKSAGWCE